MEPARYKALIRDIGASKRLGQHFLVNKEVAKAEAAHATGKNVIEMGPGLGILTEELCKEADSVTSVEIDTKIYNFLKQNLRFKNLNLINEDFFGLDTKNIKMDIMISNIPYNLSSKVLSWLGSRKMEAVLCLQKEFVEHMNAKPGTDKYSKLSVFSNLMFSITMIMNVPANDFYPVPRVDSSIVYIKPKTAKISKKEMELISVIMEHKNKKLRNAFADSSIYLDIDKHSAIKIIDEIEERNERVIRIGPEALLGIAKKLSKKIG